MLLCALTLALSLSQSGAERPGRSGPSGQQLASDLRQISVDPKHTYRIRDLQLARGDIKLYFNEGVLAFFTPVNGRAVAAVFTTEGAESGDAELILLPPTRSERASLASFTKSPNLDEHFSSTLFFFTDNTAQEIQQYLDGGELREAPDLAAALADRANPIGRDVAGRLEIPLVRALLDNHLPANGIFYAVIGGRKLGAFDVDYDPKQHEPIFVGHVPSSPDAKFQVWTNFRPRQAPDFVAPAPRVNSYRIEATVRPDLTLDASAAFGFKTNEQDGRVIALTLSPRLRIKSANIDGIPAEVIQRPAAPSPEFGSAETFLLISDSALPPGVQHQIELHYEGAVIRQTGTGEYFVDDRNTWYPAELPLLADFDLTFRCPERLRLVSTGEPVTESVENGIRTVHRRTVTPAALAGFNLGDYTVTNQPHRPYAIEVYSPNTIATALTADPTLPSQTADILDEYTRRWRPLPIHSLAVSPIAGYFGQGFPGLIYLSNVAYIKEASRSAALRNPRSDAFFSELLLPHEIAHQWWGNIVRNADYRSAWITEAMANYSALEHVERTRSSAARDEILEGYRQDLTQERDSRTVESAGPVDFGERLIDTHGLAAWHTILYEKGSWILHMLRQRLGDQNFRAMQLRLLQAYAAQPITNEDFRRIAAAFVPAGHPDRSLANFFETWVYGTGIPGVALHHTGRTLHLELTGVEDDFIADFPLRCGGNTYWMRVGSGDNSLDPPVSASSCELPSLRDFLYVPPKKH